MRHTDWPGHHEAWRWGEDNGTANWHREPRCVSVLDLPNLGCWECLQLEMPGRSQQSDLLLGRSQGYRHKMSESFPQSGSTEGQDVIKRNLTAKGWKEEDESKKEQPQNRSKSRKEQDWKTVEGSFKREFVSSCIFIHSFNKFIKLLLCSRNYFRQWGHMMTNQA